MTDLLSLLLSKSHQLLKYVTFTLITICFTYLNSLAQTSSNIYGQYQKGSSALVINPDNTFLIVGYGTVVYGTVKVTKTTVKLIPELPKHPFVLYGRYNSANLDSTAIMFQGFQEVGSLINMNANNDSLQTMQKVFNADANCIAYPNVIKQNRQHKQLYLAIKGDEKVYEYENKSGYNDFIALYLPDSKPSRTTEVVFEIKNGNRLYLQGDLYEKSTADVLTDQEVVSIIGMKKRAFSDGEFYYCNPAYNFFEEHGINLVNYKKVQNGLEHYFVNGDNPHLEDLYHDNSVIYEYKRIDPVLLTNKKYTIEKGSVFNFTCGEN